MLDFSKFYLDNIFLLSTETDMLKFILSDYDALLL